MKYIATMEFIGYHSIEFEAGNDDDAIQIMQDYDCSGLINETGCETSEECRPVDLMREGTEDLIWQI
tara:strand:- start:4786 stop:4986 length:201 start_codon:yes stop_codon:yes gene_type:complete